MLMLGGFLKNDKKVIFFQIQIHSAFILFIKSLQVIKQDNLPGWKTFMVFCVLLILVFILSEVLCYSSGEFSLFVLTHIPSLILLLKILGMSKSLP